MWRLFHLFSSDYNKKTLLELWERVETLERSQKNIRLEWENAYEKLNSMMGRIARRAEKAHQNAESDGRLYPVPEDVPTPQEQLMLNRLGPHQRRIQEQILAKRKANGGA